MKRLAAENKDRMKMIFVGKRRQKANSENISKGKQKYH